MSVTVSELAAELGLTIGAVRRRVIQLGIPRRKVAGHRLALGISDAGAQRVRASYAHLRPAAELEGWLTVIEVAEALGMDRTHVRRLIRRGKLPIASYGRAGANGGPRYSPDDLRRVLSARPVAPAQPPRGTYSSAALAALLGLDRCTPNRWRRTGCPVAGVTQRGRAYYRLPDVLAWLEARPVRPIVAAHERKARERCLTILRAQVAGERAA